MRISLVVRNGGAFSLALKGALKNHWGRQAPWQQGGWKRLFNLLAAFFNLLAAFFNLLAAFFNLLAGSDYPQCSCIYMHAGRRDAVTMACDFGLRSLGPPWVSATEVWRCVLGQDTSLHVHSVGPGVNGYLVGPRSLGWTMLARVFE